MSNPVTSRLNVTYVSHKDNVFSWQCPSGVFILRQNHNCKRYRLHIIFITSATDLNVKPNLFDILAGESPTYSPCTVTAFIDGKKMYALSLRNTKILSTHISIIRPCKHGKTGLWLLKHDTTNKTKRKAVSLHYLSSREQCQAPQSARPRATWTLTMQIQMKSLT